MKRESSLRRRSRDILGAGALIFLGGLLFFFFADTLLLEAAPDPCSVQTPSVQTPVLEFQPLGRFKNPVYLTHAGDGSGRLFIVEQTGVIRIYHKGKILPASFLDIHERVISGGEMGLLSVAFHPDYETNGRFFVNYTGGTPKALKTFISEFKVSAWNKNRAEPKSEKVVLTIDQPFINHNGGLVKFGPDRMLYIGMGDGGAGGDPKGNGQNLGTLLGDMLRIDVDKGQPYAIPADNPFVDQKGARPEIWAYGLRNPWRFSFDRCTGELIAGDVGQNLYEEIHLVERGKNYGWNIMEGNHCFKPETGCSQEGLELPIAEYDHDKGCSVTGGYIYRGRQSPELVGHYFYADFCTGIFWSLFKDKTGKWQNAWLGKVDIMVSSFGEDEAGEVYVLDLRGPVYQLAHAKRKLSA